MHKTHTHTHTFYDSRFKMGGIRKEEPLMGKLREEQTKQAPNLGPSSKTMPTN